jgi:hypothetical protein
MNFFGVEISDAQFEAAMEAARSWWVYDFSGIAHQAAIRKALGIEADGTAAPPAGIKMPFKSDFNRES